MNSAHDFTEGSDVRHGGKVFEADPEAPAQVGSASNSCYECGGPLAGPYCPACQPLYASPPASAGVRVKALEWLTYATDGSTQKANTGLAHYVVWEIGGRGYLSKVDGAPGQAQNGDITAAKAAAQADYEARIMAALEPAAHPSPAPVSGEAWRDDPSADDRWNAGLDYGQTQLCELLGVDPASVSWDAATETLDGDVKSVIGNILTARFGDNWREALTSPADLPAPPATGESVTEAIFAALTPFLRPVVDYDEVRRVIATAALAAKPGWRVDEDMRRKLIERGADTRIMEFIRSNRADLSSRDFNRIHCAILDALAAAPAAPAGGE